MAEDQQLAQDQGYPDPLTSRQVQRLESLAPEEEPPEDLTINLSTFRVPEEAQTNVVRVEDSPDTFQLQVTLPRAAIQHRILGDTIDPTCPIAVSLPYP